MPNITDSLTIEGPGANLLTVSGSNQVRVFWMEAGTTNLLTGLSFADGMVTNSPDGSGIWNAGTLSISNCAILNNQNFGGRGGGLFNAGNLTVVETAFLSNRVWGAFGTNSTDHSGYGGTGGAAVGGAFLSTSGVVEF